MKKRFLTLFALLLSAGLAAPACGGDDDDNSGDDDDNNGASGSGNGASGASGASGSGNGSSGSSGSGSGSAGSASGASGSANGASGSSGNPGAELADVLEFTGGDVDSDEAFELFPFGAAIAPDGSVFVSTLGNNDDVRSRIYKFDPGAENSPKLYFEASAQADNAIYGLAINENKLYACIAPHLLAVSNLPSTIYRFDSLDVAGNNNAGFQSRVLNTAVEVDAEAGQAQNNGVNIVLDQCTNIAFDNSNNLYVADALGTTNAIFRFNTDAFDANPAPDLDDDNITVTNYQELLTTAWLIDAVNVGGGNGTEFGVSSVAVDGANLFFVRQDDANTVFSVGLSGDFPDSNVADDSTDILQAVNEPSFIAVTNGNFVVSSLVDAEVVILRDNNGDRQATTLLDGNIVDDENSFLDPIAISIRGNQGVVVASQVQTLLQDGQNAQAANPFRLYSFNVPANLSLEFFRSRLEPGLPALTDRPAVFDTAGLLVFVAFESTRRTARAQRAPCRCPRLVPLARSLGRRPRAPRLGAAAADFVKPPPLMSGVRSCALGGRVPCG